MMLRGRNTEAIEAAREVLQIAEKLGDVRLRTRGLNTLGAARMNLGEIDTGAQRCERPSKSPSEKASRRSRTRRTSTWATRCISAAG